MWNGILPRFSFLELYSFTRNKCMSLQKARLLLQLHRIFHNPLADEAFTQLMQLQNLLTNLPMSEENDQWSYIWGPNFSCSKAYKHMKGYSEVHAAYSWIWKSCCQLKHKIFLWLLLKDRLSTRDLLRRRNMILDDYTCVVLSVEQDPWKP